MRRAQSPSQMSSTPSARSVAGIGLAAFLALLASDPALAQALDPVVRSATIIRDTGIAIGLITMTAAIGFAGIKVAWMGANFRDVSNLVFGGALAGGAAAIAAIVFA